MATATFGGIIVVVAPVSSARRTSRLPLGPLSRTYTMRRPASERSGYSDTEGDGVAVGEGLLRVEGHGQTCGLHQAVVDLIPMRRVGQQMPTERYLRAWVEAIHADQQPLSVKSLPNLVNRLALHRDSSIAPTAQLGKHA